MSRTEKDLSRPEFVNEVLRPASRMIPSRSGAEEVVPRSLRDQICASYEAIEAERPSPWEVPFVGDRIHAGNIFIGKAEATCE